MFILFIIYFRINFDFLVVYYTVYGCLELGSETSGLVAYTGNVVYSANVVCGKVSNSTMSLILIVFFLRCVGKLRFPQSEFIRFTCFFFHFFIH